MVVQQLNAYSPQNNLSDRAESSCIDLVRGLPAEPPRECPNRCADV